MDAQTFLDNFGTIAEAPDGINQLRQLILNLAVRGQLVEQHSDDESVDQLLVRLDSQKSRLAEEGSIRPGRSIPPVGEDEEPFAVPPSWAWVPLADVAWPQAGFAFKSDQFNEVGHGTPLIRIRDIANSTTQAHFDGEFREEFLVDTGDYLVGMDGNFNVRQWTGPRALLNQRVTRLVFFGSEVGARFIAVALQQRLDELHGSKAYTTVQHLSGKQIAQSPIPLPPAPEQHRIVAKLDELMALCDQLETQQQTRTQTATKFRASALDALTTAETADDLQTAWERIDTNWDVLNSDVANVDELRKLILQLAFHGRLASRYEGEARGSEIVEDLDAESVDSPEWANPVSSWAWARLSSVAEVRLGRQRSPERATGERMRPYLRAANVGWAGLLLKDVKEMAFTEKESTSFELRDGDLLLSEASGSASEVGKPAQYRDEITECCFQNTLIRVRLRPGLSPDFYERFFRHQARTGQFAAGSRGVGIFHLGAKTLAAWAVPLLALAEQHRIVARVDELMGLCDELETRLRERDRLGEALAASVVDAFAA